MIYFTPYSIYSLKTNTNKNQFIFLFFLPFHFSVLINVETQMQNYLSVASYSLLKIQMPKSNQWIAMQNNFVHLMKSTWLRKHAIACRCNKSQNEKKNKYSYKHRRTPKLKPITMNELFVTLFVVIFFGWNLCFTHTPNRYHTHKQIHT